MLSFAVQSRVSGLWWLLGALLFIGSALIAWNNFYILWLRFYLRERRSGSRDGQSYVSGIPLLGNLCALAIWLLPYSAPTSALALLIIASDLCGPIWFLPSLWERSAPDETTLSDIGGGAGNEERGTIQRYDVVRIVRLATPIRHYDGTEGVTRAPRVGDIGAVVERWDSFDPNAPMTVEAVDEDGFTLWLADFEGSELELVSKASDSAVAKHGDDVPPRKPR